MIKLQAPGRPKRPAYSTSSSLGSNQPDATGLGADGIRPMALAMSVAEVAHTLSLGRTSVYKAIAEQRLETRKFGRRTLVLTSSVLRLLEEGSHAA